MTVTPAGKPHGGGSEAEPVGGSRTVGSTGSHPGSDRAVRVTVTEAAAEVTGAVLMDLFGPFAIEDAEPGIGGAVTLVFYPDAHVGISVPIPLGAEDVRAMLPSTVTEAGVVGVEIREVARDWVEGWRDHFRPVVVGNVRVRPPWEPPLEVGENPPPGAAGRGGPGPRVRAPVDVVINPGLGFGTGLHPTTRGTLHLLQLATPYGPSARRKTAEQRRRVAARADRDRPGPVSRLLVDAGTGSGILAIAAAKLGWGPVIAFDNDPVALISARENVEANAVEQAVQIHEVDVAGASLEWFAGATVLANMTLEPVLALVRKVGERASRSTAPASVDHRTLGTVETGGPLRLVVSGILAGEQEYELVPVAAGYGLSPGRRLYEAGWVSMELLPTAVGGPVTERSLSGSVPADRKSAGLGGP